jgi:hypothetical protein
MGFPETMRATSSTHKLLTGRIRLPLPGLIASLIFVGYSTVGWSQTPSCGRPRCGQQTTPRRIRHRGNNQSNSNSPKSDPTAVLTVETEPDSEIVIDGDKAGRTDDNGIKVSSVKSDKKLIVVVTKPGYEDGSASTLLQSSEKRTVKIKLTPKPVTLSVSLDVPDADIYVSEKGIYKDKISGLEVSPGSYSINVSKFCYQSESRAVQIPAGQNKIVEIHLALLPLEKLLSLAEEHWQKKNYAETTTAVKYVLTIEPSHPHANLLMGLIMLTEKVSLSTPYFLAALSGGEQITLPVSYHSSTYYPGYLTLSKTGIEFRSTEQNGPAFKVPADKIYLMDIKPNKGYRLRVLAGIPGKKKEERTNLDFHTSSGTSINSNCVPCGDELELVSSLLMRIMK